MLSPHNNNNNNSGWKDLQRSGFLELEKGDFLSQILRPLKQLLLPHNFHPFDYVKT